jgi:hypothetical protein
MRGTKDQNTTAASVIPIGAHASVAPASYYELAKQHLRANGGKGVVVKEREAPEQWRAWLAYFAYLDGQTVPRGKKAVTFQSLTNGATVPSEWPLEFDLSAPPAPVRAPPSPPISSERRKQLADMLRGIVADIQLREGRAPTWRNMTAAQAEGRLEKLADEYTRIPPTVSTQVMEKYLTDARGEPIEFDETARLDNCVDEKPLIF